MASDLKLKGFGIVIMGVSGSGKSTVGEMLAKAMDCSFLDADDFHSKENKEKMGKGIPLSDDDRIPWLETLRDAIGEEIASSRTVILSCSALQKKYREILRSAEEKKLEQEHNSGAVKFVCLEAPAEVLAARLEKRAAEGKHFMPANLLKSQLELLQVDNVEEGVIRVDATQSPQAIVSNLLVSFNSH